MRTKDVPLLYWTAAAWGAAMALRKSDSELTADQDLAEAMMRRALALDEAFELGSDPRLLHLLRGGAPPWAARVGGRASTWTRALALAGGQRAWPYLCLAETVSVAAQNRKEFEDAAAARPWRSTSTGPAHRAGQPLAQKRARWLLARADELFVE